MPNNRLDNVLSVILTLKTDTIQNSRSFWIGFSAFIQLMRNQPTGIIPGIGMTPVCSDHAYLHHVSIYVNLPLTNEMILKLKNIHDSIALPLTELTLLLDGSPHERRTCSLVMPIETCPALICFQMACDHLCFV